MIRKILCTLVLPLVMPSPVVANPKVKLPNLLVCVQPSGALRVKQKCGRGETPASLNTISATGQQGPQGPKGDQGPQGQAGGQGPKGDQGRNGIGTYDFVPSSSTVTGMIGDSTCVETLFDPSVARAIYAPLKSAAEFLDENVVIKDTPIVRTTCPNLSSCFTADEIAVMFKCTGTSLNPTAPPGVVCIYPTTIRGLQSIRATGKGGYGFSVSWTSQPIGTSRAACGIFEAVWAFTAP